MAEDVTEVQTQILRDQGVIQCSFLLSGFWFNSSFFVPHMVFLRWLLDSALCYEDHDQTTNAYKSPHHPTIPAESLSIDEACWVREGEKEDLKEWSEWECKE